MTAADSAAGLPAAPSGAIHDIGYRHYDGPRLGRGYATRTLYSDSLRGAFGLGRSGRSKVLPMILLGVACLPALIVSVVASLTGATELSVRYADYTSNIAAVVAIYVASAAPQLLSRDLRFRTVTLYFSRPLRRTDYVLAKFAAMASAVFLLLAVPLTLLYAGGLLLKLPFGAQTRGWLGALLGAVLYALLLAGIGLVLAAVTPRRGIGVATIITVLLVAGAVQGVLQAVGQDQHRVGLTRYSGLLGPFSLVKGAQDWLLQAPDRLPTTAGAVYLVVTLLAIAVTYLLLLLRYRRVSVS
jgi:ABC-2 type transport system permease protein